MLQTGLGPQIVQDPTHGLRIARKSNTTVNSRVIASLKAGLLMRVSSRGLAIEYYEHYRLALPYSYDGAGRFIFLE